MAPSYRLRQLWRNVTAEPLDRPARREIALLLTNRELQLFDSFTIVDQRHSYRVYRMLKDAGHMQPGLLTAGLLHDIGKTRLSLNRWDRSIAVILEAVWPGRIEAWGKGAAEGWQRPFVVRRQHAEWGANMAAAAGSHPLVVELIRRHQDDPASIEDKETRMLLELLQWSDNQN